MGAGCVIGTGEFPKREGVELVDVAGIDASWPMPVALWNAPKGFDTRGRPDQQPCHVIALRLSGSLVQRIGAASSHPEKLRPNGFSVHPAHHELRFVAPAAIRFAHLYVSEAFFRDVAGIAALTHDDARLNRRVMYEDSELSDAIQLYVRRAFDRADPPTKLEMESRANLIAIRFLQRNVDGIATNSDKKPGSGLAPWQTRRICTYLEESLDRTVSLSELSALLGLSSEHICRAFKQAVGIPPQQWAIQKRMEIACRLLTETDASLTSIAQDLGYTGQSAFGTIFRNVVGQPPGQYRLAARTSPHASATLA